MLFAHSEAAVAIYHCSMKPVARGGGRSAVAAVAYRTASRLLNEREGVVHDFTAKRGVEYCEIVLPEGGGGEMDKGSGRLVECGGAGGKTQGCPRRP